MAEELDANDQESYKKLLHELRFGNPELIEPPEPIDARPSLVGIGEDIREQVDGENKQRNKLQDKVWRVYEDL
jgi:hypothetical protein